MYNVMHDLMTLSDSRKLEWMLMYYEGGACNFYLSRVVSSYIAVTPKASCSSVHAEAAKMHEWELISLVHGEDLFCYFPELRKLECFLLQLMHAGDIKLSI